MGNAYQKMSGSAGSKGVDFQINLLSVFLLNALQNLKDWRLSTDNKLAGKFDDVVLELSDGSAILLQAKHKQNRKITLDQFLSTNSKNGDFSLPKYFFSYLEVKTKFPVKLIIICTNTQVDVNTYKFLIQNPVCKDSMLHYQDGAWYFTFGDAIIQDLMKNVKVYHKNNFPDKDVDESIITEENIKEFLQHLQIHLDYPSGSDLETVIEKLLSSWKSSDKLFSKISYRDLHLKVREWFEQPKGEYLTENRAKAMFCEIKSDKYREHLDDYKVVFKRNNVKFMESTRKIIHVVTEGGYLVHLLAVCRGLQDTTNRILYAYPEDGTDIQERVIKAFELPLYTYLVIVSPNFKDEDKLSEICNKLTDILHSREYKKVVFVAGMKNELVERMQSEISDYDIFDRTPTLEDLSEDTQEELLNAKNVVFQGENVSLAELLPCIHKEFIKSETLEKLVRGEKVAVGNKLTDVKQKVSRYYVNRKFERITEEVGGTNERITEKKEIISEEDIYDVEEKMILISDSAGTGKSTVLTNLATAIKKYNPLLWVIRIELNDCTKMLSDSLKSARRLNLWQVLNSRDDLDPTNELGRLTFSSKGTVVLMFDGVDEVSPDYTQLVLDLLIQGQDGDNVAKVFITTRPHMAPELEALLDVTSFTLAPLTESNTMDFFTKYWAHKLELEDGSCRQCEKYARMLMSKVSFITTHWGSNEKETQVSPLHAKMLAEVFLESNGSKEWEGCREYLNGEGVEPKLPEKINIAKLYAMFVERKRDIFMEKGNPSGNATANEALMDQFEECLAYHRSFALKAILDKTTCSLFTRYSRDIRVKETKLLKMGIVQKVDNQLCFVHRTFAEYFVAEIILKEIQHKNEDARFQRFLINEVFCQPKFNILRHFFDNFLQQLTFSDVPADIFESYKSYFGFNDPGLFHQMAGEGNTQIIRLVLKCFSSDVACQGNVLQDMLLRHGINLRDGNEETPLHSAVLGGHLDTVQFLAENGADVNCVGKYGTPLHLAARKDRLDIMLFLLDHATDFNVVDRDGRSVLHLAARTANLQMFQLLAERGMNFNQTDKAGRIPLHYAAISDSCDIIDYLLKHNVNVNTTDKDGYTPLHLAVATGKFNAVRFLTKQHEVDVNVADTQGRTALYIAVEKQNYDIADYLLEHGAKVNFADELGRTALQTATLDKRKYIVEFLVSRNANVNAANRQGNTALHFAAKKNSPDIVEFLMKHGADVNMVDEKGRTALYMAAEEYNHDAMESLLDRGVDINFADENGRTALHVAFSNGRWDVAEFLVKHGADVNVKDGGGRTALHFAAASGRFDIVEFLVDQGAEIDIADENGYTPLHLAALQRSRVVVELLVARGADVSNASEKCRKIVKSVLLKGG